MANLVKCAICGMAGTESSFRDKAYGGEPLCFRCASRAKANIAICEGVDVKDVIIGNYTVEQLRDAKNGYEVNVDEARTKKPINLRARCPHCGSDQIEPLGHKHKNISLGKAIGGATLFGGIGLAAGFLGKSEKKVEFYCRNCGKTFKR